MYELRIDRLESTIATSERAAEENAKRRRRPRPEVETENSEDDSFPDEISHAIDDLS